MRTIHPRGVVGAYGSLLDQGAAGDDSVGGRVGTVVGEGLLPIPEVEEFLSYCTATGRSPLTVETYAYALAILFRFLGARRIDWRELTLEPFWAARAAVSS